MKSWTVDQLRQEFLGFFQSKQHRIQPSASLVPHGDPTLLLTGAGMVPFKPFFLGQEKPQYRRVTSCQRCLRTVDIDNVGETDRHGTFFEMLGNFSFGDYFKEEAIVWAWEFVTEYLEFPAERLWVSVYHEDDEAFSLWETKVGIPAERIVRLGKEDNFWEIGVGPCGPCSEIYIDRGADHGCGDPHCQPGCDCERYLEFWNLVFIQFHQDAQGQLTPLESKGIDTGMGTERVAVLMQDVNGIFDVDLFRPIVDKVASLAATVYGQNAEHDTSLRVIADHVRSTTFLAFDGVLPSNEGRGYIFRRLLRRAARHGRSLGIEGHFLLDVVDVVIDQMKVGYPELTAKRDYIHKVIGFEEERFHETLDQGIGLLQDIIDKQKKQGSQQIPGADVFLLYDTFGFPIEVTREIAQEQGYGLDEEGFQRSMEQQRERARRARTQSGYLGSQIDLYKGLLDGGSVEFVGYDTLETATRIAALVVDGEPTDRVSSGEQVFVVLERTPFYAEAGGQVADTGVITGQGGQIEVKDVRKPVEGLIGHLGVVVSGAFAVGDTVRATVYSKDRWNTARHHTSTHLLHKAIKEVVGDHANQAGSHVSPDRLRFDFTHFEALSSAELHTIEEKVNAAIMDNLPVEAMVTDMDSAQELGATALFGEKYGSEVRVVSIGKHSRELCGGTHVRSTGDIGVFRLASEGSVAAGVRRIEAFSGTQGLRYTEERERLLRDLSGELGVQVEELPSQLSKLLRQQRALEQQVVGLRQQLAGGLVGTLAEQAERVGTVSLVVSEVDAPNTEELRSLGDRLRERLQPVALVLGARSGEKVLLLSMVSKEIAGDTLHAGKVVRAAAAIVGGGGGGRPDMAQAGGRLPDKLPEALKTAREILRKQIEGNHSPVAK